MLAVVKKPHIEISADTIPGELLQFLKDNYQNIEIIENNEEAHEIRSTEWYQEMSAASAPGKTLKRYRKRAGMTQTELAQKLGMLKQNISGMENGSRGISKTTAKKLAEIFQISPARFI